MYWPRLPAWLCLIPLLLCSAEPDAVVVLPNPYGLEERHLIILFLQEHGHKADFPALSLEQLRTAYWTIKAPVATPTPTTPAHDAQHLPPKPPLGPDRTEEREAERRGLILQLQHDFDIREPLDERSLDDLRALIADERRKRLPVDPAPAPEPGPVPTPDQPTILPQPSLDPSPQEVAATSSVAAENAAWITTQNWYRMPKDEIIRKAIGKRDYIILAEIGKPLRNLVFYDRNLAYEQWIYQRQLGSASEMSVTLVFREKVCIYAKN